MKIYVGTSGYNYAHWKEVFYPKSLPQNKWLEFYSQHFNSVELNVTFYRLPSKEVFQKWYERTPSDFRFVIKGWRQITHLKRLKDSVSFLESFFENVKELKEKLICILWQMPPSLKKNTQLLESFLKELFKIKIAKKIFHSVEFRHKSWFVEEIYGILKENNVNLCIAHSDRWPFVKVLTSNFLYLRFHGGKVLYGSEYPLKELSEFKNLIDEFKKEINTIFGFFNNDAYGFAVKNAFQFRKLLEQ